MKIINLLLLLLAIQAWLAVAPASAQAPEDTTIRVLTFNIHRGVGVDEKYDLERIARIIRDAQPDVVAVQEVDKGTQRSQGIDQPARLAELTGLHATYGKAIDYQGGEYGQLILTRERPTTHEVHRLPGDPQREQRIALEVTTAKDGRAFRFVTTHLDHRGDSPDRLGQAREVATRFGGGELPVVLAGDFNAQPDSDALAVFGSWVNASSGATHLTFPAEAPVRQIDYVLASPAARWRVREARVLEEPAASDHRPLLAVLELSGGAAP